MGKKLEAERRDALDKLQSEKIGDVDVIGERLLNAWLQFEWS